MDAWNVPERLPVGMGALVAFCLGIVAWVMVIVQTWYIGPVCKLVGAYGGDVANEFAFVVTMVVYLPAMYLEKKMIAK